MKKSTNNKLRYIMYCRKSTDTEDRQVQSIEDQQTELKKVVLRDKLKIVAELKESKSAQKPGRPEFNKMTTMIQQGQADAILCWKLNRLARNPIDGGQVQWMLQSDIIKSLVTPSRTYLPSDNMLPIAVEFGMANQYSLDLSKDVKRGIRTKVSKGWRPGRAPIGYLNDKAGIKGEKKIYLDPQRFQLIKKMWNEMLIGNKSVSKIVTEANDDWGLRTVTTPKYKSGKLSMSVGYKIFTNPFYYGEFLWEGEIIKGKHKPIITSEEFDRVQAILGKRGKPRPKNKRLPFNGVVTCGECGAMITSEEKFKKIKSTGEKRSYIYHHCTKRKKDTPCQQKSIRHEELKEQIEECLDSITIPKEFLHAAVEILHEQNKIEEKDRNVILKNHQKNYDDCLKSIDNLINLYVSPDNADRSFFSDEEYKAQKNTLVKEKTRIESEIRRTEERVDEWMDLTERTFNFATYAKAWFDKGDYEKKTIILSALGQNFELKDGNLAIDLKKSLFVIKKGLESEPLKKARLEPALLRVLQPKNSPVRTAFSCWSG